MAFYFSSINSTVLSGSEDVRPGASRRRYLPSELLSQKWEVGVPSQDSGQTG